MMLAPIKQENEKVKLADKIDQNMMLEGGGGGGLEGVSMKRKEIGRE